MRNALADEILSLAEIDKRVVLLVADQGNKLFDNYKNKFPERFFNCGVAEANMISMAAGMALSGLRPITYTMAAFDTIKCLEQIKIDVCYQKAPVIIVGIGAGLCYASLGPTHQACEDIACLRTLPNMTIVCPGDSIEVRLALKAALKYDGPVYLRLAKKNEPLVHDREEYEINEFIIGKGIIIRPGEDICIISTGNILPLVMNVVERFDKDKKDEKDKISIQVVNFHTVKPLDEELLSEIFSKFKIVFTIEEHNLIGGLGSNICEWYIDNKRYIGNICKYFYRIGIKDKFLYQAGDQDYARRYFGITSDYIEKKIKNSLRIYE